MAEVKFKIDENWIGTVTSNTVTYEPGEIFEADESLGENRPWLIKQPKNAKVSEKAKDEVKPQDVEKKEAKKKAQEEAVKRQMARQKEATNKDKPKVKIEPKKDVE